MPWVKARGRNALCIKDSHHALASFRVTVMEQSIEARHMRVTRVNNAIDERKTRSLLFTLVASRLTKYHTRTRCM